MPQPLLVLVLVQSKPVSMSTFPWKQSFFWSKNAEEYPFQSFQSSRHFILPLTHNQKQHLL
jgi:hypothetical protein